MDMMPSSASLLSTGAMELSLSGMCKEKADLLTLSGRQGLLIIRLAGLLLRSALLT